MDAFRPAVNGASGSNRERIVYVGRVSPEKGLHVLLEAFEHVLAKRPNAQLAIVGGAQMVSKEYIVDLTDEPRVRNLDRFYGDESYTGFCTGACAVRCRGAFRSRANSVAPR